MCRHKVLKTADEEIYELAGSLAVLKSVLAINIRSLKDDDTGLHGGVATTERALPSQAFHGLEPCCERV